MGFVTKPLGMLLSWLYELVGSYGVALIILTVVIKLALYPLYAKQIKSTAKMSEIQPKMQEIQQKYARDKETQNEKIMELYKEEGVSMYGGCLPMVIQMFIIMGLFSLLRNPIAYIESDNILFAIHESFLWIKDLSQPDKWILPIMAGIATFLAFSMNGSQQMAAGNAQQSKMMQNVMKYFFPIMILWMARTYPAGLAIYWFGSQVVQIFYNLRFSRLRKKMKAEKLAKEAKARKKKVKA